LDCGSSGVNPTTHPKENKPLASWLLVGAQIKPQVIRRDRNTDGYFTRFNSAERAALRLFELKYCESFSCVADIAFIHDVVTIEHGSRSMPADFHSHLVLDAYALHVSDG
jgi:hypothetical protein